MVVDVQYRLCKRIHHLDGYDIVKVFGVPVLLGGVYRIDYLQRPFASPYLHTGGVEGLLELRQEVISDVLVHQYRLGGVAYRHILRFGIQRNLDRHANVRRLVHIDVANAACMAHHRNPRIVHNVAHELIGTPGDDEADIVVLSQHIGHVLPGFHEPGPVLRYALRCRSAINGIEQRTVGKPSLPAALEQHGVAGLQAQAGNLHQRIRAAFKYHCDYANGAGLPHQPKAVVQFTIIERFAQWVRHSGQLQQPVAHHSQLALVEKQPF